jgi:hypothetical protein
VGLRHVGAFAIGLLITLAVLTVMYVFAPVGAPPGYHFPRHTGLGGGMDALYEGVLVDDGGCVTTDDEVTVVVWPPGYGLEVRDGRLVVVGGGRVVGMGEPVALGGGEVDRDALGAYPFAALTADVACGDRYFLSSGWAD